MYICNYVATSVNGCLVLQPPASSLKFHKAVLRPDDDNAQDKSCGVCLLNVDCHSSSIHDNANNKLMYGGRQYHAACANFWVNCVDSTLPALRIPELLWLDDDLGFKDVAWVILLMLVPICLWTWLTSYGFCCVCNVQNLTSLSCFCQLICDSIHISRLFARTSYVCVCVRACKIPIQFSPAPICQRLYPSCIIPLEYEMNIM